MSWRINSIFKFLFKILKNKSSMPLKKETVYLISGYLILSLSIFFKYPEQGSEHSKEDRVSHYHRSFSPTLCSLQEGPHSKGLTASGRAQATPSVLLPIPEPWHRRNSLETLKNLSHLSMLPWHSLLMRKGLILSSRCLWITFPHHLLDLTTALLLASPLWGLHHRNCSSLHISHILCKICTPSFSTSLNPKLSLRNKVRYHYTPLIS